jgi:hypothetical protein
MTSSGKCAGDCAAGRYRVAAKAGPVKANSAAASRYLNMPFLLIADAYGIAISIRRQQTGSGNRIIVCLVKSAAVRPIKNAGSAEPSAGRRHGIPGRRFM